MTDSKTPEWATDARMFAKHVAQAPEDTERNELLAKRVMELAYERGRKEGIEEAAKVATAYRAEHTQMSVDALDLGRELDLATSTKAATVSASIVDAIRQLLEVKG